MRVYYWMMMGLVGLTGCGVEAPQERAMNTGVELRGEQIESMPPEIAPKPSKLPTQIGNCVFGSLLGFGAGFLLPTVVLSPQWVEMSLRTTPKTPTYRNNVWTWMSGIAVGALGCLDGIYLRKNVRE